jgi:hypothetical protein
MEPIISYVVDALFYKKSIGNKLDFLNKGNDLKNAICNTKSGFRDASPIIAREKAFRYYQSFVDILYDGIEKKYISDHQARIDLQHYFNSSNEVELISSNANKRFKISDDIFNGINVYMVTDAHYSNDKYEKACKRLIHGIRYLDYPERVDEEISLSLFGLEEEYKLFETYSYPCNDHKEILSLKRIGGSFKTILRTPFDWELFMEEHNGKDLVANINN